MASHHWQAEVTLLASEYFQVINCVTRQPENVRVVKTVEVGRAYTSSLSTYTTDMKL